MAQIKRAISMIYIAGKITGLPLNIAKAKFNDAHNLLSMEGQEVVNPIELITVDKSKTWKDYMVEAIELLISCDEIFVLNNYEDSKGALLELHIAKELGMRVRYE